MYVKVEAFLLVRIQTEEKTHISLKPIASTLYSKSKTYANTYKHKN